ncbi:MAG: CotH kinase family protein, partial [Verrucomicrobiales bacterium]|nr:CotH kinase family protein [Verrucomicrobiales bacterium]
VYDGVPDYTASSRSVHPDGAGHVWPSSLLTELPVYHWIIRDADMDALMAHSGSFQLPNDGSTNTLAARRVYNSEGAFVYDGIVYDHVTARLRGGNSRFQGGGKRHFKFRFKKGHHFQARDQQGKKYPRKWRTFNTHRLFGNIGGAAWGLPESVGGKLWDLLGVPIQKSHYFHFRVIDNSNETSQYGGDFWGLNFAQERYDVRFLDSHDLPKGNLYKLSDWVFDADRQRRYQAPDMANDGSEFRNIFRNLHPGQNADWLREHVDYDLYYRYSAVTEAVRHYDLFPYTSNTRHGLKNWVWHFVPTQQNPTTGQLHTYPYDFDASWGPNWNNGWDHATNALYGHDRSTSGGAYIAKPEMVVEHKNVIREFRDLVWQPDQISAVIDHFADTITAFAGADRDRWTNAPASEGRQNDPPVSTKVRDMMNFAFVGGSWPGGNAPANPDARDSGLSGRQGRDAYLDAFVRDNNIPNKPTITYTGNASFPTDGLSFRSSSYSDPQGSASFANMQWRIGEIEDPAAPSFDPAEPTKYEITATYESAPLAVQNRDHTIPTGALKVGRTYRARVRMQDNTNRWSHWSNPVEFTTSEPVVLPALQAYLMVTEVMYHPAIEAGAEYIELHNISTTATLDLTDVRFTKGIDYDFPPGTSLAPGAYILVVKNRALFESIYGDTLPVAGEWDSTDSLSNGGERIKLSHGSGTPIHDFTYDDAGEWPTAPDGTATTVICAPGCRTSHRATGCAAGVCRWLAR